MTQKANANTSCAALSTLAVALLAALAGPACAQDAGTASTSTSTSSSGAKVTALSDVTVTAAKRKGNAQKTAIALSVIDDKKITSNGVGNIEQLATISPSVDFAANGGGASIITMRGVSGRDTNDNGETAVAVNIDDFYIQRPTGLNANFYDLERIEILRGPQGTLYGRNATGGAINIITKKPELDSTAGYVSVDAGNYNTFNFDAGTDLPVTRDLAARVSVVRRYNQGYRDNGAGGHGDDTNAYGGRLQLLYKPNDALSVLLGASYLKQGGTGSVYDGVPLTYSADGSLATRPASNAHDATHFALNTAGKLDAPNSMFTARVEYAFDDATLTYLGGYNRLDYNQIWDNDGGANQAYTYERHELSKDTSHELRLASNNSTGFLWQGGLYYFNEDSDGNNLFNNSPLGTPVNLREYHLKGKIESKAVFGQVSYDFTDKLRGSFGARYSKDSKSQYGYYWSGSLTQDVTDGVAERTYYTQDLGSNSSKATWHAGLDYTINENSMVYAKVDTGYKAGGFTLISQYKPETLLAYEIGSKNRFFDNSLQANFTGFYYDYKDQQVSQYFAELGGNVTTNAGASRIYGLEVETVWAATDTDKLDLAFTWLHGRYTDFSVSNGTENVVLDGNTTIQSPDLSATAGYEHYFDLDSGARITARLQTQFKTSQYFTFYNRPYEKQDAYTRTDFSLEYTPNSSAWTLQAYARNLENKVVLTNADSSAGVYQAVRYQYAAPRTFGLRFRYDWY